VDRDASLGRGRGQLLGSGHIIAVASHRKHVARDMRAACWKPPSVGSGAVA
jgi:hypothetical protein